MLKKSADAKNLSACCELAGLYEEGRGGVGQDLNKAFELYKTAAEGGDGEGALKLGRAYLAGSGVEASRDEALSWLEKADELGNREASWILGVAYYDGFAGNDYKKAFAYLNKSAEAGSEKGAYFLATMYESGKGVEKDIAKAFELYKTAADLGNVAATVKMAKAYLTGEGAEKNVSLGARYAGTVIASGAPEKEELLALVKNTIPESADDKVEISHAIIESGSFTGADFIFLWTAYSSEGTKAVTEQSSLDWLLGKIVNNEYNDKNIAAFYYAKALAERIAGTEPYPEVQEIMDKSWKLLQAAVNSGMRLSFDENEHLDTILKLSEKYGNY